MKSETLYAIGLMSGTSLDGLDICFVSFCQDHCSQWNYEILEVETIVYPKKWEEKLKNAIHLNSEDLLALNAEYGFYLGDKVREFIIKNNIKKLDVISSHGHTVYHQPHRKFTLQIGDGRAIKIINNFPIAYDFRSQDVLMGGNGAPLVPIGDQLLFSDYDACINLGGFSNISFQKDNNRLAFDICPVNIVLNLYAQKLGKPFDENGDFAKKGNVNDCILNELNNLLYYKSDFPKSLGVEWVNQEILPILKSISDIDVLATVTEHSAVQIAQVINGFGFQQILVTGGGAYNCFLIEKIQNKIEGQIVIPKDEIINFKEALIFAFMGVLRLKNQNNVLASATGCFQDHCSGILI